MVCSINIVGIFSIVSILCLLLLPKKFYDWLRVTYPKNFYQKITLGYVCDHRQSKEWTGNAS